MQLSMIICKCITSRELGERGRADEMERKQRVFYQEDRKNNGREREEGARMGRREGVRIKRIKRERKGRQKGGENR